MHTSSTFASVLRADDMTRELQGVHRGLAAHEANNGALHGGPEAAPPDQLDVEARREKAGTGGNDDMADAVSARAKIQPLDRLHGQQRGFPLEQAHPISRRRKPATEIEAIGVNRSTRRIGGRRQAGPALRNLGTVHHPLEQGKGSRSDEHCPRELDECVMNLVGGNCRREAG